MYTENPPKGFDPANPGDFVAALPIPSISCTAFLDVLSGMVLVTDDLEFDGDVVTKREVIKDWHVVPGVGEVPLGNLWGVVRRHVKDTLNI